MTSVLNSKSIKLDELTSKALGDGVSDEALYNSKIGREILSKRIRIESCSRPDPTYKIVLSPNGKKEVYRIDDSDYFDKYLSIYNKYNPDLFKSIDLNKSGARNLNIALDIAVAKMIKKHPTQKPWYMRIYDWPFNKNYEYNKPSRAFEWLTGIKPVSIGENGLKTNLVEKADEVLALLNKLGNSSPEDYSFIIMTGGKKSPFAEKWHCLPVLKVDNEKEVVDVIDKRKNTKFQIHFVSILKYFKSIVGINWKEQSIKEPK